MLRNLKGEGVVRTDTKYTHLYLSDAVYLEMNWEITMESNKFELCYISNHPSHKFTPVASSQELNALKPFTKPTPDTAPLDQQISYHQQGHKPFGN